MSNQVYDTYPANLAAGADPAEQGQQHFAPGPVMSVNELATRVGMMVERIDFLLARMQTPKLRLPIADYSSQQLDSSGNATFPVYSVAPGMLLELTAASVEVATFDTTTPRTPASPYSHADFWLGLYVAPTNDNLAQGGLIDFTPTTDAAQGIPNVATYEPPHLIMGGNSLMCYVKTGPASQRLTLRYAGWLSQQS